MSWEYDIGEDWDGDPCINFMVILSDEASSRQNLHGVATAVRNLVDERVQPFARFGLIAYFRFRSQSEQEALLNERATR